MLTAANVHVLLGLLSMVAACNGAVQDLSASNDVGDASVEDTSGRDSTRDALRAQSCPPLDSFCTPQMQSFSCSTLWGDLQEDCRHKTACGAFNVLHDPGADYASDYYYDAVTGKLIAVFTGTTPHDSFVCIAGPQRLPPGIPNPSCDPQIANQCALDAGRDATGE
jgi:hypothetical protein